MEFDIMKLLKYEVSSLSSLLLSLLLLSSSLLSLSLLSLQLLLLMMLSKCRHTSADENRKQF